MARQQHQASITFIRSNTGQEVRIHMPRTENSNLTQPIPTTTVNTGASTIQQPPPAFNREDLPPPSYQDYRKDVLVQPPRND